MSQTLARIKKNGIQFEIMVDLEEALKFRKGESNWLEVQGNRVFLDAKKGNVAPTRDLEKAFGTANVDEIGKTIVKKGEVLVDQEHRDEEKEKKYKQVIDFLVKNAIDPKTGHPI